MPYNRANGVNYAHHYWDKVCHDGHVATAAGGDSVQAGLPLSKAKLTSDERDCTHSLSCCVGNQTATPSFTVPGLGGSLAIALPGGGLNIPSTYTGMYGQVNTPKLVELLKKFGAKTVGGEIRRCGLFTPAPWRQAVEADIRNLAAGDVLVYAKGTTPNSYAHMALIVASDGQIACYTRSRFGEDYTDVDLVSHPFVTLPKMPG